MKEIYQELQCTCIQVQNAYNIIMKCPNKGTVQVHLYDYQFFFVAT
jgi:hypothetical protein